MNCGVRFVRKVIEEILNDDNYFNRKKVLLSFSCEEIVEEAECDRIIEGSFSILADEKYNPTGAVYTSDMRMLIENQVFHKGNMEIMYQFDAKGLPEGSSVEGSFAIVSNMGEYELPYRITVKKKVPQSSLGEVRNLFHFANLAKSDWEEAKRMFYSPDFENVILQSDRELSEDIRILYRSLSAEGEGLDGQSDQNMENFLVMTRKKNRNTYATDISSISMKMPEREICESFRIVREGWGYTCLSVEAEGDFLSLHKDMIFEEDFAGNVCEFYYEIERDALYPGINKGSIILHDVYTKIVIPVEVDCTLQREENHEPVDNYGICMRDTIALVHDYLDFRTGKTNKNVWIKESGRRLEQLLLRDPDNMVLRLYQTQLFLSDNRIAHALQNLEELYPMLFDTDSPVELQDYYYYLQSLACENTEEIRSYAQKAELLYVKNVHSWRLAWILLYLKESFTDNDQLKWDFIKNQFSYGNASPILYVEALQAVMRTPSVMQELSEFEISFLLFVKRHNVFTREIRNRFIFLAPKVRAFSGDVLELLIAAYEKEEKDETLQEICSHLMKGNKIGQKYFRWYSLAVEKEIRINRLYEYYLMSIDLQYTGRLPKIILMYFAYRSNLDYERNAFLYANVLMHKEQYQDIYSDYLPHMEKFACEQLLKGRINDHLVMIYNEFLYPMLSEPEFASAYMNLFFLRRIHLTGQAEMKNVVVTTEALKEDEKYPIYQGQALIGVAGSYYTIALEDANGNRYIDESLYTIEPMLKDRRFLEQVIRHCEPTIRKALYLAENSGEKIFVSEKNEEELLWLSKQPEITEKYRVALILHLAEYYFEKDEIVKLDSIIERFDPEIIPAQNREVCIRIMVARGMYEKAIEWIHTYGTWGIDYKILVRLLDRYFVHNEFSYDPEDVAICHSIFRMGKYDETILNYLIAYGNGTSQQLKMIWRAADSFNLDTHSLLEKMLVQILYSDVHVGEETNIYLEYVKQGANVDMDKAFLTLLAYRYFHCQEKLDSRVFDRVITHTENHEKVSLACKLAYLKKTSEVRKTGRLFDNEKKLIPVFLSEMAGNQIFFPFFMDFKDLFPSLQMMEDRCYIEYRGKEGSRVILHYVVEHEGSESSEYKKEEMPHMYAGIYVKSFILFYGERIQYYITEEDGRQEKLTMSSSIENKEVPTYDEENATSRFAMVNQMVYDKNTGDYGAYCELLQDYEKQNYLVKRLFLPV